MLGETIAPCTATETNNEVNEVYDAHVYDDGRLRIEYDGFCVKCGGRSFYDLARKVLFLLACLARHAGRVVSHDTLWAAAWPAGEAANHHTLRVHVGTLRRKLAPYGIEIASVVHLGYRLIISSHTDYQGSNAVTEPSLKPT